MFVVKRGWRFPPGFRVERYYGLVSCSFFSNADGSDGCRLVTQWQSKDLFESAVGEWFRSELGLGSHEMVGFEVASEKLADSKPWWGSLEKLYAVLITVVAIGTNLQSIGGIIGWLAATPSGAVTFDDSQKIVVLGETNSLSVHVQNTGNRKADVDLDFRVRATGASASAHLHPSTTVLSLEPLETRLVAPRVQATEVGDYIVECSSRFASGLLTMASQPSNAVVRLSIWPPLQRTNRWSSVSDINESSATYRVSWRHGRPSGKTIRYQATMTGCPDCEFVKVYPAMNELLRMDSGGVAVLQWRADAHALQSNDFSLYVTSRAPHGTNDAGNRRFWNEVSIEFAAENENR